MENGIYYNTLLNKLLHVHNYGITMHMDCEIYHYIEILSEQWPICDEYEFRYDGVTCYIYSDISDLIKYAKLHKIDTIAGIYEMINECGYKEIEFACRISEI